jgi:hypothetical protein
MPTCTVLGKIFSTIACECEYINDMLDLKLAIYTPFSVHMQPGLFLSSSDDFESFDFDEQIEMGKMFGSNQNDFILLAHKSPLNVGKDHGVYAPYDDETLDPKLNQSVFKCKFVAQKPSIQRMRDLGMVMLDLKRGNEFVFTDSAFYFSHERITSALIEFYDENFEKIVLNKMEIDAYRDFLQPLGTHPILKSDFLKSTGVNLENVDQLKVYERLHNLFSNRNSTIVLCKNSDFYHLGTLNELLNFYLNDTLEEAVKFRSDLCFTRFKSKLSDDFTQSGCALNSKISKKTKLNNLSLIEYCFIDEDITFYTNEYCMLNNCMLTISELKKINQLDFVFTIPSNICMHTIPIKNGKYLTIFFNRNDDLKKNYNTLSCLIFLGKKLPKELCMLEKNLKYSLSDSNSIWNLRIFRSYDTMTESFFYALKFIDDYLNERNVDQNILVENVETYSLFDILKIQDYEKMILYRIDMGL